MLRSGILIVGGICFIAAWNAGGQLASSASKAEAQFGAAETSSKPSEALPKNLPIRADPGPPLYIDADGAPDAYHPENTGLDDLSNAGGPALSRSLPRPKKGGKLAWTS